MIHTTVILDDATSNYKELGSDFPTTQLKGTSDEARLALDKRDGNAILVTKFKILMY